MSGNPQQEFDDGFKLKETGNEAFKKGDFKTALKNYTRILMHIGMNPCMNVQAMMGNKPDPNQAKDPIQVKTDALRLTAFNNIAMVHAKHGKWEECKNFCDRVLKHEENNTKALYRRGMANRKLGLFALARKDYDNVKSMLDKAGKSDPALEKEMKMLKKNEKDSDKEFMKAMKKSMEKAKKINLKKMKKKKNKTKKNENDNNDDKTTNANDNNDEANKNPIVINIGKSREDSKKNENESDVLPVSDDKNVPDLYDGQTDKAKKEKIENDDK